MFIIGILLPHVSAFVENHHQAV